MNAFPALALALLALPATAQDDPLSMTLEELRAYDELGSEGRYALYRDSVAADPGKRGTWLTQLAATDEHQVLEWLVLSGEYSESQLALEALRDGDAPQWMRCAVWVYDVQWDSHSVERSADLLSEDPDLTRSWLAAWPDARSRHGLVVDTQTYANARDDLDVSRYDPPFDAARVYGALESDLPLVEADDPAAADGSALPVHAVLRAIDALRRARLHEPRWLDALLAAAEHADARVARRARLAWSSFPEAEVPFAALFALADLESAPADLRHAALLGASYGLRGPVFVRLHELALAVDSPLWEVAVDRLGDLGNGYTLQLLQPLVPGLDDPRAAVMGNALKSVRAREAHVGYSGMAFTDPTSSERRLLEAAAVAVGTRSELAATLTPWTVGRLAELAANPDLRRALRAASEGYEPAPALGVLAADGVIREHARAVAAAVVPGRDV